MSDTLKLLELAYYELLAVNEAADGPMAMPTPLMVRIQAVLEKEGLEV